MRLSSLLVTTLLFAACSCPSKEATKATEEVAAAPAPVVDPFEGCRLNATEPRWFLLACREGKVTLTVYAVRDEKHDETAMVDRLKRTMKTAGATWLDLPPFGAVRSTYVPQGSQDELVTIAGAWKPDGTNYAPTTCIGRLAQEARCISLIETLGRTGLPESLAAQAGPQPAAPAAAPGVAPGAAPAP
jgi:hypothetical protein